ncbi:MAG: DsbA family protein [Parcubacteria group bacterium]
MRFAGALIVAAAVALAGCQKQSDAAFDKRVHDYLVSHPEVLQEAYEALQVKQEKARLEQAAQGIAKYRQQLEHDPRDFVANPNGQITVVEFFDYNCGYCKAITPEVLAIVKSEPDVRFVFKDFTIFGEASEYAAAGADLAKPTGKYMNVYQQFMAQKPLTDDGVKRILTANGVDPAAARTHQQDAEEKRRLEDTHNLAVALGIEGTPAFVVGNTLIPGADPQALGQAIAAAKKQRKS